ncbi:PQQ-binding-like beta-propeller repeat protein [Natrinema halophilum]|uniref:PQQ-binding-like beta-propeller repeat protein n=1 Tax=Natrinema halophilum TaxID=1699371 RepID=A0A7D5GIF7_9EURY|nr:PQQ-binding-like beta-propeller repeat protein [Natrinema halophilum]QLG49667.1 PQQ-binding-like beta-propeller repeat protein [Natrinema halophilum]
MQENGCGADGQQPIASGLHRRRFLQGTTGVGILAATGIGSGTSVASRETATPAKRWQREFPSPGPHHITAGDECVFASQSKTGSSDGEFVIALEVDTGDEAWRYDLGDQPIGSLTVANDTVFVRTDFSSHEENERGILLALDVSTGDEVWRLDPAATDGPISRMKVIDDVVCAETPPYSTQNLYAFDAETGEERWSMDEANYSFNDFSYHYDSRSQSTGGKVFVTKIGENYDTNEDDSLLAIDAATGEQVWESPHEFHFLYLFHDGTIYFGREGTLHALNATTGEEEWTVSQGYSVVPLTVADGTLFLQSTFLEETETDGEVERGRVHAVDLQTGNEQWQYGRIRPGLVTVSDGTVLLMEYDTVYGINESTGEEEWSTTRDGYIFTTLHSGQQNRTVNAPVVDDTLFVSSYKQSKSGFIVDAVDIQTGKTEQFVATDSPTTELTARNGTLFNGTETHLYALDVDSGSSENGGESGSGNSDSKSGDESSDSGTDGESGDSGSNTGDESSGSGDSGESGDSKSGAEENATDGGDAGSDTNSSGAADDGASDSSPNSGDDSDDSLRESSSDADDETPGMGIPAAVTSLGGIGYVLRRRLESDDS